MNITVKNVKIAEFASEETMCFEATVYIDGKRAFVASNDGHGGPNMYHGDRALLDRVEAYAQALPKRTVDDIEYQPTLDCLVEDAIAIWEREKLARKILKKAAIAHDGKVFTFKFDAAHPRFRPIVAEKYPGAVVLNDIAFEKAVELISAAV